MDDEYENLVAAIALIDAAIEKLQEAASQDDAVSQLHDLRNDLNHDRVELLGNGQDRPFHMADIRSADHLNLPPLSDGN